MSWKDKDIDKLFQDNAANASFEYKNEYWKEFEAAALPVKRQRGGDFLWITTAVVFLGIVTTMSVLNQNRDSTLLNDSTLLVSTENKENRIDDSEGSSTTTNKENDNYTTDINDQTSNIDASSNPGLIVNGNTTPLNANANPNGLINGNTAVANGNPNNLSQTNGNGLMGNPINSEVKTNQLPFDNVLANSHDRIVNSLAVSPLMTIYFGNNAEKTTPPVYKMPPIDLRMAVNLYFELNGGLSESIVSPSEQYSNSFGAGVGIELQKNNYNFTAGVNGIIANHNDIRLNRNAMVYGFGSDVISTHLNYSQIYSVEGNISFGYNFNKHLLTAGVRPSFIVGSKVHDQTVINDIVVHDIQGYGYMDGLRRFGLKPQIGYAYKFKKGFTLGANLGVQLMKSLNEEFINGENNSFPLDGQVYFRKSIRLRK